MLTQQEIRVTTCLALEKVRDIGNALAAVKMASIPDNKDIYAAHAMLRVEELVAILTVLVDED